MNHTLRLTRSAARVGLVGLLSTGAVLLGGLVLAVPVLEGFRLDRHLAAAREKIEEVATLYPLYIELLGCCSEDEWGGLPCPPRRALTESDVMEVSSVFSAAGRDCGMELISLHPRVVSAALGGRRLQVELQAVGPYARIPDFLLAVMRMPALEEFEAVDVWREPGTEAVRVKLYLALQ